MPPSINPQNRLFCLFFCYYIFPLVWKLPYLVL
nr:MAG TPA: hypothetical protein [Caudoviricetes sp.]